MGLQAGRLYRQGDDAYIDGAVLELFNNLVAEVSVNTDLHAGIEVTVLGKDIGQDVKAGRLVGPITSVPRGLAP